jgi:hypothetical protein
MRSAFGVEHGEISKGLPKGLERAATFSRGAERNYAIFRSEANLYGKHAAKSPHARELGHEARTSSRASLRATAARRKYPYVPKSEKRTLP